MQILRSLQAVALAAMLAACSERAPSGRTADAASPGAAGGAQPTPADVPPSVGPSRDPAAPAPAPAPASDGQVAPAAGPAPAPSTAAGPAVAAAPAGPPSVATVFEAVAVEPSGATLPLVRGHETVVDPGARFEVTLSIPSPDARLVLLDVKDALVAAEGAHEVGQATRLTLAPSAPLTPGRRYTLRVDGATTRELHDASGKAFTPVSVVVLVAGDPPRPDPKGRKRRR